MPTDNTPRDKTFAAAERHGVEDRNTGTGATYDRAAEQPATGSDPTGGDRDADAYQARVVGEEAVGGPTPTPEQNVTEHIEEAAGLGGAPEAPVEGFRELTRRDRDRWQLDPDSAGRAGDSER